ncbi:MAG: SBBP repeat-containing protein [Acidobacteriia bacterium]|nr:SBBP repeat-containing protein [Terriglobia bacterium]
MKILAVFAALTIAAWPAAPLAQTGAPRYEVDRAWPKPLPDRWVLGGLGGVCVDAQDHVLVLNRQDVLEGDLNAGHLAPSIIELDAAGAVVNSWGDPALLDPRLHSCFFDKDNAVWIASSPSGMVQRYSHDGSTLLQTIGKKGVFDSSDGTAKGKALNSNAARFFMPSSIVVDPQNGDVYVSDGESANGNRRIAVLDKTGAFLRQWQPEGMVTVHCMTIGNDGLVYVCNREGSRIQVYDKMGRFLKNIDVPWKPYTAPRDGAPKESGGSAVALAFSRDANQRLMYVINQNNSQIEIIERQTGRILSSFGRVGHSPGEFDQPHGIAVDSKGNVYIADNRGKRVQKFVPAAQ